MNYYTTSILNFRTGLFRLGSNTNATISRVLAVLVMFLLVAGQNLANDLYPSNVKPDGDLFFTGDSIQISFDVCFRYDYPVNEGECVASVTIEDKDSNKVFDKSYPVTGNGPDYCKSFSDIFTTNTAGTYTLIITVNYIYEINPDNNSARTTFEVASPPPPDPVSNISPPDGSTNIKPSSPPSITWKNGNAPIKKQKLEIKQGSETIVNEELPPDAESYTIVNDLLPLTQYVWFLVQTNSEDSTENGPFTFFTSGDNPSNFKLEVNKINYLNYSPPSPVGFITVNFTPRDEGEYLNIWANNKHDTKYGIILSNLYLPSKSEADSTIELSTTFDFTKISSSPFSTPFDINLLAYVTKYPAFDPLPQDSLIYDTTVTVTDIKYGPLGAIPPLEPIDTSSVPKINYTVGDKNTASVYRPDPGNLDLDSSGHPATDTYAGDINACVPTATANSMKWLERKSSKIKLPGNMTLRNTMETLSGLMQRKKEAGTPIKDMIKGKLDFIEQYKLPMEVKFQANGINGDLESSSGNTTARNFNNTSKKPTWTFLKKMIEDGEDVEINFTWLQLNGKWAAHSVNLTAIQEFKSGVKKIMFKHDLDQLKRGGLKQEVHQISIDANGWMRFGQYNQNFIYDVVAESPTVSFGEKAAAWLNEFFTSTSKSKSKGNSLLLSPEEFIEIIAKQNISNLHNYRATIYDSLGQEVVNVTLDEFTAGVQIDSFTVYTYTFPGDVLPDSYGGIGLAFSGSPIPGSFISWGDTIKAVNGDWTSLTSTDIGIIPVAGSSIALVGNGTASGDFSWVVSTPTPGNLNPTQTVPVKEINTPPAKYNLSQNYPNPFNPSTTIRFDIPRESFVKLEIFNVLGEKVSTLISKSMQAGKYEYTWNAGAFPSGVYFYRLSTKNFVQTKKLLFIK